MYTRSCQQTANAVEISALPSRCEFRLKNDSRRARKRLFYAQIIQFINPRARDRAFPIYFRGLPIIRAYTRKRDLNVARIPSRGM